MKKYKQGVTSIKYDGQSFNEYKRKQLAQQIFFEAQQGYYQAPMDFYHAVTSELNNISDRALDVLIRQRE